MTSNSSTKRVAIVTGAARGIGKAIALRLAQDGLNIIVSDLQNSPYEDVVEQISSLGVVCKFKACDVRQEEQVEELVNFALGTFQRLDVVSTNIYRSVEFIMIYGLCM